MNTKRPTGVEIAREMARQLEAGRSTDEMMAEVRRAFPIATTAELMRACLIAVDHIDMWEEDASGNRREDLGKVFDLMVSKAPEAEIAAAVERTKLTAANLFPMPDKTKS